MECRINLEKSWFTQQEREIVCCGEFTASAFVYPTGIEAVRIRNARGEIIMLPYQGQQVWDAVFDGRSPRMGCMFDEPHPADVIVDSYGAFAYHCGALGMGNPGPGDTHVLHGELPCAKYHSAALLVGEDVAGGYIGLTGVFHYKKGFGDYYDATPVVLLHAGKSVFDMSMRVENIGNYPMDLMYMAHVNFRIGDDARIVQTVGWSTDEILLRTSIPAHVKPTPEFLAFIDKLKVDPKATEVIRKTDVYDPEIVFFLPKMKVGKDGLAHVLQIHMDGSSDVVSYDPRQLNKHARWILKNRNQNVIGILPATAEPEGYTAEKKKGNVRSLGPGESAVFAVRVGTLSKAETVEAMKVF
ncbi:MAG: DUF4432 domain-containing protein [Planctomycetota bacterium]|jgi:hypothetical protein|nr:DUF4432 domain-containing protein [Planctomycetota bacterium]